MALPARQDDASRELAVAQFLSNLQDRYYLVQGDAEEALKLFPSHAIDTCITSPPYWAKREYDSTSGLGAEAHWGDYVARLVRILHAVRRVLRPEGSLWLNIGDTYLNKNLCGIPWRVAFALQEDGWILRNSVVWDKVKGNPCNAKDKLRNVYEHVFHFVQQDKYFYDVDAIRNPPGKPSYRDGKIVTPTGVSGAKYEQQIRGSKDLTPEEKEAALAALAETLRKVEDGAISDFRMIIRGAQRSTHSDSKEFSGRANELQSRGFCILPYHKNGSKPGDVWHIIPEDEWRKDAHYAVFPQELCELPIKATCPQGGVLLDPFAGTGTALVTAVMMGRRGIGIDTSARYLLEARRRLQQATIEKPTKPEQRSLFDA
jgi:DNA modification methylase